MGSQQQFCLRWNNHQINMLGVFDELLQSESLVDVTLACEGVSLKAHKVVLSACSPFFQSLFVETPCKHPIVILKDVKYSDLKALIDFMYRGEVNVSQNELSTLLKTAEMLKIKGLAEVTGGMNTETPDDTGPVLMATAEPEENPPQPPPPPLPNYTQESTVSPSPNKRKRIRARRRSTSSVDYSDRDDANSLDGHNPLEIVEAKVEIVDDEYEKNGGMQHASDLNTGEMQMDQSSQPQSDSTLPPNSAFATGNNLDPGASTSNASMNSTAASLPSSQQPLVPPNLQPPSIPSTSGSQSGAKDLHFPTRSLKRMVQNEENFQMAMAAVASGEMGFCRAAKKFGVNHATLWRHYNHLGLPSRSKPPRTIRIS